MGNGLKATIYMPVFAASFMCQYILLTQRLSWRKVTRYFFFIEEPCMLIFYYLFGNPWKLSEDASCPTSFSRPFYAPCSLRTELSSSLKAEGLLRGPSLCVVMLKELATVLWVQDKFPLLFMMLAVGLPFSQRDGGQGVGYGGGEGEVVDSCF